MKLWVFLVQMMDGGVPYCIGSELWPSNSSFGMSCWSWCPMRKVWTLCCQESPALIYELHLVVQPTLHLEVLPFWPWKINPRFINKFVWTVIWAMVLQCKRYQVNTDSWQRPVELWKVKQILWHQAKHSDLAISTSIPDQKVAGFFSPWQCFYVFRFFSIFLQDHCS